MALPLPNTTEVQIARLTKALYNAAPGYTYMTAFTASAGTTTAEMTTFANWFAGTVSTDAATLATTVVTNLGLTGDAATAGTAYLTAQFAANAGNYGRVILDAMNALAGLTSDATYGTAASAFNDSVATAYAYSIDSDNTTTNLVTLQAADEVSSVTGQTFTLTTAPNTVAGTTGNDTIDGSTADSWSAFDAIDGGAGTDTMNAYVTGIVTPGASTIVNVETLNVNTTGAGYTIDTTGYTGLTSLKLSDSTAGAISVTGATTTAATVVGTGASSVAVIGTGGALSVSTGAAAIDIGQTAVVNALTSVSTVGGTTVKISDNKTTTKADGTTLTTVTLNGNTGNGTLDTDGLTTLNLTKLVTAGTGMTVNAAAGTRALAVTVNGVDSAGDGAATGASTVTFTDATATSLAISAATAASYDVTAVAGAATAVTIDASVAVQMDALTAGVATTVGISGAGAVEITADTLAAAAVVTSTNTGGVTLTQALTANQQFVGTSSTGADVIGVATAFTKAISTGAGADTVTYGGPAGSGGTIDAGADTDTIMMTGAIAETATGSATFAGTVSNFEVLELSAATGAARTINMTNADGINSLAIQGATVGALAVTNAAANFTLTQKALTSFASSVTLADATGSSDNVNLVFKATDGFTNTAAFTIANVETLTITTDDTDTTAATALFVAPITATSVKTVTVAGDVGINLTGLTATTLTSLDASAITGTGAIQGLTWTAGALAASSTIKGSATGDNTVVFSAANTASTFVTYTGGSGADTVTGSNGLNNVVTLGDGANSYTQVGAGNATVTGGSGVDTISVGTGANTISAGAGNDSITVGAAAGLNTIDVGTGTDTVVLGGIQTAAGYYTSVTGMAAGDIINFAAVTTGASADAAMGAKITLGGASSFANYLDAATAGDGSVNALSNWFQYGTNTYLVVDNAAAATFQDGVDSVIELVGLIDLTTSATVADVLTLA